MKKQKQNISASIDADNEEGNMGTQDKAQTYQGKRERVASDISEVLGQSSGKKQRIENEVQGVVPEGVSFQVPGRIEGSSKFSNVTAPINAPTIQRNMASNPGYNLFQNYPPYSSSHLSHVYSSNLNPVMNSYQKTNSIYGNRYNSSHLGMNFSYSSLNPYSNLNKSSYSTYQSGTPGTSGTLLYSITNQGQQAVKPGYFRQNLPEKQKYVIKDIPEMTVGSYLQNKNVQDMYLSGIKKKEDEISKEDTTITPLDANQVNNSTPTTNVSVNVNLNLNNTTNNNTKDISPVEVPQKAAENIPTTITNFNIHNYNYNYNITQSGPVGKNNIVLETKSAQPQIGMNKTLSTMNTMLTTLSANANTSALLINPTATATASVNTSLAPRTNAIQPLASSLQTVPATAGGLSMLPQQTKPGEFSDSLQRYIQRAFEKCKTDLDIKKCQKGLMKIIGAALKKGDLNTRDWNNHTLPVLPSEMKEDLNIQPDPIAVKSLPEHEQKKRENRKDRFNFNLNINFDHIPKKIVYPNSSSDDAVPKAIVGTCTDLEKQYLRLTTLPDPSQVRPEHILKLSLKMLKEKWKNKLADYSYISEQFRSIRQDMTIQHIQNEFTVKVYETHARIALESMDIGQFNQCQTALISLYEEGLNGNKIEFLAYRILYTTLYDKIDMGVLLKEIDKSLTNFEITHAIKAMKALNELHYFQFFKLYKIAPNMGSYLIEPFLPRLRIKALQVIAVGYFTEIGIDFLVDKLAFPSAEDCIKFLEENSITLSTDKKLLLCKESIQAINSSNLLTTLLQNNINT